MVDIINMIISWAPTVLFLVIILISFLTGVMRGLRKSLILLIHAFAVATICILLFFYCARSQQMDAVFLVIVNKILGGEGALQNTLSVSTECTTIRQVLLEYIPTAVNFGEGMTLVIKENGQYLLTIVDLVYNMIFALVFTIIYFLLIFLLYIIYLIFYSERKHKRKIERKQEKVYKKRRLFGGLVGAGRGLVVSLILLSFLGNTLYVVTGGTGEGKLTEHSFGNETYDTAYTIYRSIDNYGSTGIYKVLNAFKDKDDQPYYLFAADLVFSGRLEDENLEINENIKFREEIGAYVGFAKDTANLLIKYGGEDINAMLNGTSESSMDFIVEVMENQEFQGEFETLINEFDAKTYFINLGFSFINSVISNIDNLDFAASMDPAMLEMIKILFKEGHYSEYIPDERDAISQVSYSKKKNSNKKTLPYLSVNKIIQKEDILTLFKVLTTMLNTEQQENETQEQATLRTVKEILPYINELSIFSSERKDEINPVLTRLYCFVENKYLTEEGADGITTAEIEAENISWVEEINSLVDLAVDVLQIVENVYVADQEILDIVVSVFDSSQEKYTENMEILDSVTNTIESSKILGKVLSSNVMKSTIVDTLSGLVPNMYIDEGVSFVNKYNDQGEVIEYGELHQVFEGFKLIGKADDGKVLKALVNSQEIEITDLLDKVSTVLEEKDEEGNTVTDYLLESKLLHSALSAIMVNASEGEDSVLYITDSVLETNKDNEKVNLIKKETLKEILDELGDVVEVIKDLDQDNLGISSITPILKSEVFGRIINKNNPIIEGSIAKLLINTLSGNEMIIIPRELETIENWFSTEEKPGEIKNIVYFVTESDIDIEEIIEGEDKLGALSSLESEDISNLLASQIMHYTISNYVDELEMGDLTLIIPYSSKDDLDGDVITTLIKKDELEILFNQLLGVNLVSEIESSQLMYEFIKKFVESEGKMLESNIIVASVTNFIMEINDVNDENAVFDIPTHLAEQGEKEELQKLSNDDDNLWRKKELGALIYALEEIFDTTHTEKEDFIFNSQAFDKKASVLLNELSSESVVDPTKRKIDSIYESEIIVNTISQKLDGVLISSSMLTEDEVSKVKDASETYTLADGTKYAYTFYTKEEVLALSDCLDEFEITDVVVDNPDNDLSTTIKGEIPYLNDIADEEKHGADVSKIDLMYESKLIKMLFTKKLDEVLTEDVINPDVRNDYIKMDDTQLDTKIYPKEQIENLVDAINKLNITDMDSIGGIDFEDVKENGTDNFDTIYKSDIVAGMITKKLLDIAEDNDSILVHYSKAFQDGVKIYKKQEVKALMDLLAEVKIDDMVMEDLKLGYGFITDYIYDNEGKTNSYLITATLSKDLLNRARNPEETLVIPKGATIVNEDDPRIIKPSDLADLLRALLALTTSDSESGEEPETVSITELNISEQLTLPEEGAQEALLNSIIIRASFTPMIKSSNPEPDKVDLIVFSKDNIEKNEEGKIGLEDVKGDTIIVITEDELKDLFNALRTYQNEDNSLSIPNINDLDKVIEIFDDEVKKEALFKSDIFKYRIVGVVKGLVDNSPLSSFGEIVYETSPEKAYKVITDEEVDKDTATLENTEDVVEQLSKYYETK